MSLLLLSEAGRSQLLWEALLDSASRVRVLWYKLLVAAVTGEGNGTHSSTLAWRIPWPEEPGGLQSMGLRRVGHY